MIYLELFLSFFQMGLFGFGGGYAVLPLIKEQVVIQHPWLTMSEFTDLITISQMTPGPIVVNSATFIGLRIAGVGGAFVATAGSILPSCIIVTMIAKLYLKYRSLNLFQSVLMTLRPCIVAMIASAGISILITAFWGNDAGRNEVEPDRNLRTLCFSVAEKAYESCSGDAACRNTKGFGILYWWINER